MAALIVVVWDAALVAVAFVAGRLSANNGLKPESTGAAVATALQLITDEGLISPEHHEDLWRLYATKVRAA